MAGAGYRNWSPGDIPTADQFDTFLQEQTIMRFASAAARDTALSVVKAEGMVAYLVDSNRFTVYNGTAWLDLGAHTGNPVFANTAARDAAIPVPVLGMVVFQTDLGSLLVYNGAAWSTLIRPVSGAWPAWTPVITQGVTVTATLTRRQWTRTNRRVTANAILDITSSGTASAIITVSLPVNATGDGVTLGVGTVIRGANMNTCLVASTGGGTGAYFLVTLNASSEVNLRVGSGSVGGTTALVNTDKITMIIDYEAAADA